MGHAVAQCATPSLSLANTPLPYPHRLQRISCTKSALHNNVCVRTTTRPLSNFYI